LLVSTFTIVARFVPNVPVEGLLRECAD